jgi:hypothetical protein
MKGSISARRLIANSGKISRAAGATGVAPARSSRRVRGY